MCLAADSEDQRHFRRDQSTGVPSKGWIHRDAIFPCLQVWRFSAACEPEMSSTASSCLSV